jgi:hypothetical protein
VGHPALRVARLADVQRIARGFLQWEIELHEDMYSSRARKAPPMIRTGAAEHEVKFDDMIFERDGIRLRFRGSIDRVEVSVDERIPGTKFVAASDYKTSIWSTPGSGKKDAWDDGVVLQVPLYAYALSKLRPDYKVARVDYLSLKNPEHVHLLQLYTFDKKSGKAKEDDDATAKWQHALDGAIHQIKRVRAGEFPAGPPPSCNCPPWCHGRDICRVPGGPRNGGFP